MAGNAKMKSASGGWFLRATLWPLWLAVLLAAAVITMACTKSETALSSSSAAAAAGKSESAAAAPVPAPAPEDNAPMPQIDAKRAFEYTRQVTAFGPRYMGNEAHKKLERYILDHLKGDEVESDEFTADTVEGKFPVHNIIAKFPGKKDGIIAILGHYDTNYPLRNIGYVGANDGGSSTAILLEYANYFREQIKKESAGGSGPKLRDGYSVWLVWTDGEEAVRTWSDTDSLYGARHLAEKWEKDGTLKKIKALFVMDMIAAQDVNILRDDNSTRWLLDLIHTAAERGGYQSHFYALETAMEDDHLPFVKRGVPSADVIDMPYGYNDVYHHTAQDTMDKLDPKSLEIVGNTILETVHLLDQR
jgi:Zn-dependent M28 family amino/carboxypeptidase